LLLHYRKRRSLHEAGPVLCGVSSAKGIYVRRTLALKLWRWRMAEALPDSGANAGYSASSEQVRVVARKKKTLRVPSKDCGE